MSEQCDIRSCSLFFLKFPAPGFFEDLNTFIQEVAPVVKRKKDRLEPWLKEHAKICGWHYCLVEGCGKNRSADLLMTWMEALEHFKGHGLNTEEVIEAATKLVQIRIKVEGTCECNEGNEECCAGVTKKRLSLETYLVAMIQG